MRLKNQRVRLLASTMIAGMAFAGMAVPAVAQSSGGEAQVDDIVVTGSRIRQANLVTTSPVTQMTAENVRETGVTRVEDLVTQLPQAFAAQNSTVSNGASGTATVSLRNLGAERTLVLVDGKRLPYGSPGDAAADLNQIPAQLVERVEVLTGGASAVYGSDAIAGVVNFIMKKNFEGLEISAQYGQYQHNNDYDGPGNLRSVIAGRAATNPAQFQLPDDNVQTGFSRELTAVMGVSSPDGRGNITAYAGYRKNNKVLARDYDYAACSLGGEAAGEFTCGGSATGFPGRFITNNGSMTLDANNNFIPYSTGRDAYNFGPLNYFQRPDERYTLGALGHYQVNDKMEAFAQLMFTDYKSVAQIAPSGNFANTSTVNCDNPLISASQLVVLGCDAAMIAAGDSVDLYVQRRNVEGGGRQAHMGLTSYRGVVGLRGDLDDAWSYEVSAQFSKVKLDDTYRNEFSVTRLTRAMNAVRDPVTGNTVCASVLDGTDASCVPYNVFVRNGVTQEALNYLQVPLVQTGYTEQQVVSGSITGDLTDRGIVSPWATRGLQVAFGAEYRRDSLDLITDVSYSTGDGAGQGGPTIGLGGSQSTYDLFGEFQLPIVEGAAFAESITLDGAYRASDYAIGGKTDTWKLGLDYAPVSDVRLRASYQAATRAPNVIDLYTGEGFNLFDMDYDPCDATKAATYAGNAKCVGTNPWQVANVANTLSGDLTNDAGQYNRMQGGFLDLTPEDSKTTTLGIVFTPRALPGFNLSIDYFDIEITNLIQPKGAANIVNYCFEQNMADACALISRNPGNGSLYLGNGYVKDLNTNIGGLRTSGIDFVGGYTLPLDAWGMDQWGSISLSFTGTYLSKLETDTGAEVFDCAGKYGNTCASNGIAAAPEYRHRASAQWSTPWDGISMGATWRYISEVEFDTGVKTRLDSTLEAQHYLDLNGSWQVRDNVVLRAGVNNVFDRDPPLSYSVGTTGNNNTYPQVYDAMGRYLFVSATASF